MLSQKALLLLRRSKEKIRQSPFLSVSTSCARLNFDSRKPQDPSIVAENSREIRKWREGFETKPPILPIEGASSFFAIFRTKVELTPWGLKKQYRKSLKEKERFEQQFIAQRHEMLGPDLALAHFLTFIGGKIKFKGSDKWIKLNEDKKSVDLPDLFDPNYVVEEIDASDVVLYYEGLENFKDCPRVKRITFARNPVLDDWCIDRISSFFPLLEHLDLSDCPKVSERGLEALYRIGGLKTLIVTNNYKSAAFELTCMMLEDVIPGLQINIRDPKTVIQPEINE